MREPIRVLSVQHYPKFGGPHNEILKLEDYLNEHGISTIVVISDEEGDAAPRLERLVRVEKIRLSRFRGGVAILGNVRVLLQLPGDVRRLRRLIRECSIDVVKVHGPHNPHGAIAALLEGTAVVWVLSSNRPPRWARYLGTKLVALFADAILANGRTLLNFYPGTEPLSERIYYYFPPVDTNVFRPLDPVERSRARTELGLSATDRVVGTVANINPQKGIDQFLHMASLVKRLIPDCKFVIVGGAAESQKEYWDRLQELAMQLGLDEQQLLWLGHRDDVEAVIPLLDVKVIASRSEGTTATAGEALACCVPVVAFDVGGVRDIVENGLTGRLVEPGNVEKLARCVVELCSQPDLLRSYGEAGRIEAHAKLSVEECGDAHLGAYRHAWRSKKRHKSKSGKSDDFVD